MRQRQEQRALVVAGREQAVCATSKGSEWLDDAQQKVLVGAARRPTVAERERIVEAAEGRIEADLARRKESLAATSTGSMLLRAEYGEGGSASSPQQSFAKREAVIARVAQQVDEELEAHEEMLRSMPLGRQYLSAAEQARAGGASGPPTPAEPAERESMVRAAEQRVREELDRREERVLADTGDGRLLTDAAEELTGERRDRRGRQPHGAGGGHRQGGGPARGGARRAQAQGSGPSGGRRRRGASPQGPA